MKMADDHHRQRQAREDRTWKAPASGWAPIAATVKPIAPPPTARNSLNRARADADRPGAGPPKIAVPTRTIVLPAAIAASRSAVMPIDKVSSASPASRRLSNKALARRCTAFWASKSAAGSGIVIRPRSARRGRRATSRASASTSLRRHAGLGRAAVDVDLDAHLQRRHALGALLGQALGHLEAIDRVGPVEVGRHQPRLVALDRADAMPFQRQVRPAAPIFSTASWM